MQIWMEIEVLQRMRRIFNARPSAAPDPLERFLGCVAKYQGTILAVTFCVWSSSREALEGVVLCCNVMEQ